MIIVGAPFLPDSQYTRRNSTEYLVVHCAETPASLDVGAHEIRGWHMKENGWKDIGYHYVIRRNGVIERGRPWWAVGSHVKDWNHCSMGVSLVGGCNERDEEENNFTDKQWTALREFLRYWRQQESTKNAIIQGHRDFPGVRKYCPSFDVKAWLKENSL